jgi:major membrane immunogen (membrane-anchored lipoprotein)
MAPVPAKVFAAALIAAVLGGCGGGFPRESANTRVAVDTFDEHGWQGRIAVTFADGKIQSVVFEELNKGGRAKSRDAAYARQMEPTSGTTPARAIAELQRRLVAAQDPQQVQAVTGATATSQRFQKLAAEAVARR